MKWTPGGTSGNIEDRRSSGGFGGGGMKLGLGGLVIAGVLTLLTGQDFFSILGGGGGGSAPARNPAEDQTRNRAEQPMVEFVSFVLDDAQATWHKIFAAMGRDYREAKLVLFRDGVASGCGNASSAMGPFYCPPDQKVYIDLSFYEELDRRFGAPGDFAQAYVLAHEIGHHVQTLLGVSSQVHSAQQRNPRNANALSVRMELQADCLAGIWGHSTAQRGILEKSDVEEGLNAAAAVGDDRLSRGRMSTESFTHGSSEQRASWFKRGLQSGEVSQCDTFQNSR